MTKNDILHMPPLELAEYLKKNCEIPFVEEMDTPEGRKMVGTVLTKASSMACFFTEMEMLARNLKREMKRKGCPRDEADNILGVEEVFASYKKIAETHYDQAVKMMTLKRICMDEDRRNKYVT